VRRSTVTSTQINSFIRTNYTKLDDHQLASKCGISKAAIEHRRLRMGLHREKQYQPIEETVQEFAEKRKSKIDDNKFKRLLEAHEALKRSYDAHTVLRSASIDTHAIAPARRQKGVSGEATIVALLSDTHLEETVRPEMTNGLGGYNLDIAKSRFEQYFRTLLRLIEIEQKATPINNLVLALLGDYISGDIHEELLETCSLQPMDAILRAQDWIASGIQYLLDKSDLKLTIVCHSGNHARTTKKIRHSTEPGHSIEFLMYNNLARLFEKEKRITWVVPEGYLSYLKVYNLTLAFHHGHNVKYGGGVGGITISMNKAIAQWNRARAADIYCCGHFHQVFDGGSFVVNGSMIGYNAFAIAIKAAFERPAQILFAIHSKLGKYMVRTIYFDGNNIRQHSTGE
jgi:hypothetical protein